MTIEKGDYVLATKYDDGDPGDGYCVGFYDRTTHHNPPRHMVVDGEGNQYRGNGFRRVGKISHERGTFLVDHIPVIDMSPRSLWWWKRKKMT